MGDTVDGFEPLLLTAHVSRLCGASKLDEDGRPTGLAFRLRMINSVPEEYLSVNWLEYLHPTDRMVAIVGVRAAMIAKSMNLPAQGCFATLHVEATSEHVRKSPDARELFFRHVPEMPHDPSHSGIFGLEYEDDLIADMIAETVIDVFPARVG